MDEQKKKTKQIKEEIAHLDQNLNENQTMLNKLTRIAEKNNYACYIKARGDRIDEESEEE